MNKVVYINLEHRIDRKQQFEQEMIKFGLDIQNIERFPAILTDPGYIGASLSHAGVMKNFLEGKYGELNYIAVFEDDFVWNSDLKDAKNIINGFLENNFIEWDVILIGGNSWKLEIKDSETCGNFIKRCYACLDASSYIVNRKYAKIMLDCFESSAKALQKGLPYSENALDVEWKKLQKKDIWFITIPGLGRQSPGYSDIEKKLVRKELFV